MLGHFDHCRHDSSLDSPDATSPCNIRITAMSTDDIKEVTKSLGDVVLDASEHQSEYA